MERVALAALPRRPALPSSAADPSDLTGVDIGIDPYRSAASG
ncbi:hypothetical protein AB0C06_13845 [Micromonospora inaquosa]|jgi:hypothetical protein|nr:hypothetical protein [Micromonospora inaquosa]